MSELTDAEMKSALAQFRPIQLPKGNMKDTDFLSDEELLLKGAGSEGDRRRTLAALLTREAHRTGERLERSLASARQDAERLAKSLRAACFEAANIQKAEFKNMHVWTEATAALAAHEKEKP